jgi:RNA polymerase sigma factor (sigma-70 family)
MTDPKRALLTRLFNEHGSTLEGYLFRRTGNHADAAELTQETYLRMWQVKDIEQINEPKSYMFTIARHLADHRLSSQSRLRGSLDASDPVLEAELSHHPDFAAEIADQEELDRVRKAFDKLPANVRAAHQLQAGHGMSYEEIARHLGVTTHAVKKYLQQVVPRCREELGLDKDDDEDADQ